MGIRMIHDTIIDVHYDYYLSIQPSIQIILEPGPDQPAWYLR